MRRARVQSTPAKTKKARVYTDANTTQRATKSVIKITKLLSALFSPLHLVCAQSAPIKRNASPFFYVSFMAQFAP